MNYIRYLTDKRVDVKTLEECLQMVDAPKMELPMFNSLTEHRRTVLSRDAEVEHLIIDFDKDSNSSKGLWKNILKPFEFWMYDTSSSCAESSCFRVVLPLKESVNAVYVKYKNECLCNIFFGCDPRSFDIGRWFFCPPLKCKYGLPNKVIHNEGESIDFYALVKWSPLDNITLKQSNKHKIHRKFANMSDDERISYYLSTEFPLMRGNGDSASSLYTAICVCLHHKDDDTLAEVLDKARRENWSEREIKRKLTDAKNFLGLLDDADED